MELDIFLPTENLAFEYQGEQHYYNLYFMRTDWLQQKQRDKQKKEACNENGITLIEIPYWWDRTKDSLMATVKKHRPDLIQDKVCSKPIPDRPPFSFQDCSFDSGTFLLSLLETKLSETEKTEEFSLATDWRVKEEIS